MFKLEQHNNVYHLAPTNADALWGVSVTKVGCNTSEIVKFNPINNQPEKSTRIISDKGHVHDEYQLHYITRGKGILTFGDTRQTCRVSEGNMILLLPGMWYAYTPSANSEWKEYRICFKGAAISAIANNGILSGRPPVYSVGLNESIVDLYYNALQIAGEQKCNHQHLLGGIVLHLMGMMLYCDKALKPNDCDLIEKIDKSKVIMRESIYKDICPQDIAKQLNISYSGFRRAFKSITGTAPMKYILDLRLIEAKKLLVNSPMSIKEISYSLNFDTPDYFTVFFKKRTNQTPLEYRYAHSDSKSKPVFLNTASANYQLARVN